jgi:hypothetical protein
MRVALCKEQQHSPNQEFRAIVYELRFKVAREFECLGMKLIPKQIKLRNEATSSSALRKKGAALFGKWRHEKWENAEVNK